MASQRLLPDPIRTSPHSKLAGCGSHGSYRHLHHQRGTVGTFHVRLLEGKGLRRKHWSALSLGPMKHLGLSGAHGEVSSFGTLRLAFWGDKTCYDDDCSVEEEKEERIVDVDMNVGAPVAVSASRQSTSSFSSSTATYPTTSSSMSQTTNANAKPAFMPSMPRAPSESSNTFDSGKSPLTPLFDQGCIRTFSPARSPFFPSHASTPQQDNINQQPSISNSSNVEKEWNGKISSTQSVPKQDDKMPLPSSHNTFGLPPPHHYAREEFKSSTVHNDSNPIWGDAHSFLDAADGDGDEGGSTFRVPLRKDDLLPELREDAARVSLEVRLDEEMAPTESLLVGGALSTAVGAAGLVPGVGKHAKGVSNMGMEMLGLGTDRTIGRGYVDLTPLLLGLWEENWVQRNDSASGGGEKQKVGEDDATLDEYGCIDPMNGTMRRRVERMGMMDVWVPLYHPTNNKRDDDRNNKPETSGKIHLLISYKPNGMAPKRDDVVAFESFARRPLNDASASSANAGPIVAPVVPPLSPLLVVETHSSGYLLLEYPITRTVTAVDRAGNVKSSRWERFHRVRVRRSAVFVVERRTLADAVGSVARMPGDVVMSTSLGREVAEASAPIVAGALELMGPALLWGKLMVSAGGMGVRASLAGAQAATEAVVSASVEKALERRDGGGGGYAEQAGDAGVYSSYGG